MTWNGLTCKVNCSDVILMLKCPILMTGMCCTSLFNPFALNVPLTEKPGRWF